MRGEPDGVRLLAVLLSIVGCHRPVPAPVPASTIYLRVLDGALPAAGWRVTAFSLTDPAEGKLGYLFSGYPCEPRVVFWDGAQRGQIKGMDGHAPGLPLPAPPTPDAIAALEAVRAMPLDRRVGFSSQFIPHDPGPLGLSCTGAVGWLRAAYRRSPASRLAQANTELDGVARLEELDPSARYAFALSPPDGGLAVLVEQYPAEDLEAGGGGEHRLIHLGHQTSLRFDFGAQGAPGLEVVAFAAYPSIPLAVTQIDAGVFELQTYPTDAYIAAIADGWVPTFAWRRNGVMNDFWSLHPVPEQAEVEASHRFEGVVLRNPLPIPGAPAAPLNRMPVPGATVVVEVGREAMAGYLRKTDSQGRFAVEDLPWGRATAFAWSDGSQGRADGYTWDEDAGSPVEVELSAPQ